MKTRLAAGTALANEGGSGFCGQDDRRPALATLLSPGAKAFPPLDAETAREMDAQEYQRHVVRMPWLRSAVDMACYAGQRVLEIGFGSGIDLVCFARYGARVYGVEKDPDLLHRTQTRLHYADCSGHLLLGGSAYLPFKSGSFDLVFSLDLLRQLPDPGQALREVRRVLKPGGKAIIGLPNRYSYQRLLIDGLDLLIYGNWFRRNLGEKRHCLILGEPWHRRAFSGRELAGLFRGFGIISAQGFSTRWGFYKTIEAMRAMRPSCQGAATRLKVFLKKALDTVRESLLPRVKLRIGIFTNLLSYLFQARGPVIELVTACRRAGQYLRRNSLTLAELLATVSVACMPLSLSATFNRRFGDLLLIEARKVPWPRGNHSNSYEGRF